MTGNIEVSDATKSISDEMLTVSGRFNVVKFQILTTCDTKIWERFQIQADSNQPRSVYKSDIESSFLEFWVKISRNSEIKWPNDLED